MRRVRTTLLLLIALLGTSGMSAQAGESLEGSIGLSLGPLVGQHIETGDISRPPPIPLPIGQVSLRYRPFEVFVESFPESPDITERFTGGQSFSTRLGFLDAVVRAYDRAERFWVGGGEVVYNQSSTLAPLPGSGGSESVNASRVVGGRYEFGAGLSRKPGLLRLWVDVMPALSGVDHQYYRGRHFSAPERGAQFEAQVAVANAHGPFKFDYGIRYLNYTARFAQDNSFADRNVGFIPYATFAYRFGDVSDALP